MRQHCPVSSLFKLCLVILLSSGSMFSQKAAAQTPGSAGTYGFGKITRAYTSVANSTGAVPTLTGTTDEGVYNSLPIGFTFRFAGVNYTTASASTNGWMTLGQNLTAAQATP